MKQNLIVYRHMSGCTCCSHFLTIIVGVNLHYRQNFELLVCETQDEPELSVKEARLLIVTPTPLAGSLIFDGCMVP